jgi:hypothetical protein
MSRNRTIVVGAGQWRNEINAPERPALHAAPARHYDHNVDERRRCSHPG